MTLKETELRSSVVYQWWRLPFMWHLSYIKLQIKVLNTGTTIKKTKKEITFKAYEKIEIIS